MTTTWTLIIVFSWLVQGKGFVETAHSGFSVPGFVTREDCKLAQAAFDHDSKSACVRVQQ
jgi:hypothetical protein